MSIKDYICCISLYERCAKTDALNVTYGRFNHQDLFDKMSIQSTEINALLFALTAKGQKY